MTREATLDTDFDCAGHVTCESNCQMASRIARNQSFDEAKS